MALVSPQRNVLGPLLLDEEGLVPQVELARMDMDEQDRVELAHFCLNLTPEGDTLIIAPPNQSTIDEELARREQEMKDADSETISLPSKAAGKDPPFRPWGAREFVDNHLGARSQFVL